MHSSPSRALRRAQLSMAAAYGKLKCSGAGGSLEYPITRDATKIGRSPEKNDVVLNDSGVSRWHCRVTCEAGADYCTVTDLSSANGTHVNGARIEESVLRTGDQVQIGDTFLTFIAPVAAATVKPKRAAAKVSQAPPPAPVQPSAPARTPAKVRSSKPATPGPSACVAKVQEIEARREERRAAADARSRGGGPAAGALAANFEKGSEVAVFANMLQDWHEDHVIPASEIVSGVPMWTNSRIRVCVRKRPLNRSERSGTLSALDVITGRCTRTKQQVVVHHPKERVDLTKYESRCGAVRRSFFVCTTN